MGSPPGPGLRPPGANLSVPLVAKRMARGRWEGASTLTAKRSHRPNDGAESAELARQTRIIGGSSDTEQNELAVKPRGVPSSPHVVTTTTPEGKRAIAARKSSGAAAARSVSSTSTTS